jgi:hypothetical protein
MINKNATTAMNQRSDRKQRRFPRRAAYIIARYTVKEGTFRDIIKNIGATGIFVSTTRGVASGQAIELEFPVFEFENQIRVKGTVSRSSQKGFSVVFDQPIQGLICKEGHFPEIVHESNR